MALDYTETMREVGKWAGALKFFPTAPEALIGIAEQVSDMCSDAEQVRWLVKRVSALYREWPGAFEVRAVLCSKFKPADGVEAYSQEYPAGIPSEKPTQAALEAPPRNRQIAGAADGPATAAPSIQATLHDLAVKTDMKRIAIPPSRVREIPVVEISDKNRITPEMIAAVEADLRRRKAEQAEAELKAELNPELVSSSGG